jgi:hypothetical protein
MLCWLQPQPQTQINGILMVVAIPTRCFSFRNGVALVSRRATFPKEKQLSNSRRTKSIVTEASAMEGLDNVSNWQRVFATFISSSLAALGHPYFYLMLTLMQVDRSESAK